MIALVGSGFSRTISFVAIAVLTGFVPARAQEPTVGVISGTVVGRASGTAVPNAVVSVEGSTVKVEAGPSGWFRIANLQPGDVVLRVDAPGHLQATTERLRIEAGDTTSVVVEMQPTPNFMERLQVTASKSELAAGDVAGLTTVLDREGMEMRGDYTLAQALANTTGVVVTTERGLFDSVQLRGFPRGDPEHTSTLVLIDGVPQTLSSGGARLVTVPIRDAGLIEVARGPNSALYGRSAIGGAVSLRTADPTASHRIDFDIGGGGFGTAVGSARASGPVQSWGGYYASVSGIHETGYFTNKVTPNFDAGYGSLFGKLTFALDPKGFGSFSVQQVRSKNSTPTAELIVNDGVLLHDIDPDHQRLDNVNIAGPNYEQGETRLTFNYTRSLTPTLKLVEILGYRDVQLKFIKDGYEVGAPFDLTANTLTMRPFNDQTDESIFYEELRLELTPQFGQLQDSFVVGGSYERTSGKNAFDRLFTNADLQGWTLNYLTPVIPAENTWQHAPSSRTYHLGVGSFFGQYTFEPTPRVVIVGGARYDHLSMDADLDTGEGTDTSFDAFSPKVGATFRLRPPAGPDRPTLNLYGTYSRAFMPPLRPGTLMPGDPELNLDLEDVDNYEAGLKGTGFNRRLAFSGGFFWMKQSGIVAPTRQGDSIVQDNSGEQTYTGGEAEATWVFNDKITGYANAAIYHHRYGQFVIASDAGDPGDIVLTDNRLPTSPDYLFNLGAFVKIRPELDLIVDVKRTGPMPANPSNTYEIDGSTLVDAALSWRFRMLRFTLSAHNMLGDEYYALSDGSIADPGRPRQVILNAAVHVR